MIDQAFKTVHLIIFCFDFDCFCKACRIFCNFKQDILRLYTEETYIFLQKIHSSWTSFPKFNVFGQPAKATLVWFIKNIFFNQNGLVKV